MSSPNIRVEYDPTGTPTLGGASNFWPFQYQGMEQEFVDAPYYYSGNGQFYSPQLVRSLSETGATSSQGTGGGPSGNGGGGGGGGGGSNPFLPSYDPFSTSGSQIGSNVQNEAEAAGAGLAAGAAYAAGAYVYGLLTIGAEATLAGPPGWIVAAGIGLFELFDQLFGGGSDSPPIPRQLRHGRHPLYPIILGVSDGLVVDEGSEGLKVCGDPYPSSSAPLQRVGDKVQQPNSTNDCNGNVNNAEAECLFFEGVLGPLLHGGCVVGVRACYVAPSPYSCGMMVGCCGSAALLDYECYKDITEAKAACK